MKKLFLLDAMALIYRSHFALAKNPRITSTKINTSAVFGFTNTLLEILKKENPTHIAVAFDTSAPTFRHTVYPEYKGQREAQPEDITLAIPYIFRLLEAFNITILRLEGFEADDIIGTFAKKAQEKGDIVTYMMTPDKDFAQIVGDNVFLYKPASFGNDHSIWGVKEVLDRWELQNTSQVIDILGLQGDAVDNIPGIPSVGEKTAIKLIKEYQSVENVIANGDKIAGKLGENVRNFAQQALLSKNLATIDINVPLPFEEDVLLRKDFDKEKVKNLFEELEFKTLSARLFEAKNPTKNTDKPTKNTKTTTKNAAKNAVKNNVPAGQIQYDLFGNPIGNAPNVTNNTQNTDQTDDNTDNNFNFFGDDDTAFQSSYTNIYNTIHHYHLIDTPILRQKLIKNLLVQPYICFDTETTGLTAHQAEIVGLSFAYTPFEAYYIPFSTDFQEAKSILTEFSCIFEHENIAKIAQNLKYDYTILQNYGIEIKGKLEDTMLLHYLLSPDAKHNLNDLSQNYLQYQPVEIEELIGKKGKNQLSMRDVPLDQIKEYACEDADVTLQLWLKFSPLLTEGQRNIYEKVEMPLVPVLVEMERNGVKIDTKSLKIISEKITLQVKELEKEIYALAGTHFNIASPKQLGEILFETLKLDSKAKKTRTGQYATGEDILQKLKDKHKIIPQILEYREIIKLQNTYIDAIPELINPRTQRVHTTYQQAIASTGRLSSTNPNLQNIPIRTERGKEIRKAFVAENSNNVIVSADYSQIELRIMAHFAQDITMIEAFKRGDDIHTITASKINKILPQDVTPDMRRRAKTANFGIIYGVSAHGLAEQLDISRTEAKEFIDEYFNQFPNIKTYMDNAIMEARNNEYVETLLGRRRYLRSINSQNQVEKGNAERNAINAPIQGTAADMIKLAMIEVFNFLKKEKLHTKLLLQVHDELVFEVPQNEIDIIKQRIPQLMQQAMPIDVPVEVGLGVGDNWLEAH